MEKDDRIESLIDLQKQSLEKLASIHRWVVFFGVLTIISLTAGATYGLMLALEVF